METAIGIWTEVAARPGLESRHYLQAWTFLRQAGRVPDPDQAKRVLGVILEMPIDGAHDVLVAYEDGSSRYLNHSGQVAILDDVSMENIQQAIQAWLQIGRFLVEDIGPWERPQLPELPPGHVRIMILTPSGPHFGQGPQQQVMADRAANAFIQSATALLQLIVPITLGKPMPN